MEKFHMEIHAITFSACMYPAVICRKGWREVRTGEAKEAHSRDRLQETGTSFANSGEL